MWLPLILNTALPLALLLTLNSFIYARLATVRQYCISVFSYFWYLYSYFLILPHTSSYFFILSHTFSYFLILSHTSSYSLYTHHRETSLHFLLFLIFPPPPPHTPYSSQFIIHIWRLESETILLIFPSLSPRFASTPSPYFLKHWINSNITSCEVVWDAARRGRSGGGRGEWQGDKDKDKDKLRKGCPDFISFTFSEFIKFHLFPSEIFCSGSVFLSSSSLSSVTRWRQCQAFLSSLGRSQG